MRDKRGIPIAIVAFWTSLQFWHIAICHFLPTFSHVSDRLDQRRELKKKRDEPEVTKDYREIKKEDQDRDEDGKRDLDTGSVPGSGSMPQKE